MKKLILLVSTAALLSFQANANDLEMARTEVATIAFTQARNSKVEMTAAVLAAATDEYLLYDGTSVKNPLAIGVRPVGMNANTYMNGLIKNTEALYLRDGSKLYLDQYLNNNGNQNIIDWQGIDRLKDIIIRPGFDKVVGPGGLGGS